MKNLAMNKSAACTKAYLISALMLLGVFFRAEAGEIPAAALESIKTFDGQALVLEDSKLTHLIFQDIWNSYEGLGEEARVAALPKAFVNNSQQVWVQPGMNVTEAQLAEYQRYYPHVKPLVLDRGYRLMRSLGGWDLPLHVILNDGKKVFSGSGEAFSALASKHFSTEIALNQWLQLREDDFSSEVVVGAETSKPVSFSINKAAKPRYHKPEEGDQAPVFTATTMSGNSVSLRGLSYNKPLSLVFLDSLCPMPHFPGCEAQIEQLSHLVTKDYSREWLGIVSSFYVNEDVVQQFRDKYQLKLPLVFDTDNQIYQSYGVHASPYQIDITRDGRIRSRGSEIH
ncbi:MAG: redoxin domain-containing protein [Pseudomonadales bacterium]|nr:redoxin domain-containing protein [Pseudomonadales bacterium]